MQVRGALDGTGAFDAYDFSVAYPSNGAPTLALLLTRAIDPVARSFEMGDRTARPPYAVPNLRVTIQDMAPILRASWLRGVSALPNSFAHESFVDELASLARVDPVEFRLRHLNDERGSELLRATAERAGWVAHDGPQQLGRSGDLLHGRGVAYARYVHGQWPGVAAAWSAWVADVDVDRATGEVHVRRVVVGQDSGLVVNPAGARHQVQGNVIQTTSRALQERVRIDPQTSVVSGREWGSYPILDFRQVPVIEVVTMPRPCEAPLGVGESASVPGTAAIANAIFDATGIRFRQPPFTPEVVRAALHPLPAAGDGAAGASSAAGAARGAPRFVPTTRPTHPPPAAPRWPRGKRWWAGAGALLAGVAGFAAGALGWRAAMPPIPRADVSMYTAATIERGRQLAAVGNCVGCHTAAGGAPNAGGLEMPTPFGTIRTTNITPDVETGIGGWSLPAFQRAMREGIARDGRHLYPAFPYPSYTRTTDEDLTALYAWLMSQPAVRNDVAASKLAFPYGVRPLMALWNALFLQPGATAQADPSRSAAVEPRRVPGQRPGALRRVPHRAQCIGRGANRNRISRRRDGRRLGSAAADLGQPRAGAVDRGRVLPLPAQRLQPAARGDGRTDGPGDRRAGGASRRGRARDGALPRVVQPAGHRGAGEGRGADRGARGPRIGRDAVERLADVFRGLRRLPPRRRRAAPARRERAARAEQQPAQRPSGQSAARDPRRHPHARHARDRLHAGLRRCARRSPGGGAGRVDAPALRAVEAGVDRSRGRRRTRARVPLRALVLRSVKSFT